MQTHFVPDDELMKLYRLVREALELKFKILDIMAPKYFSFKELQSSSVAYDMRDRFRENEEKLSAIAKLLEGFPP